MPPRESLARLRRNLSLTLRSLVRPPGDVAASGSRREWVLFAAVLAVYLGVRFYRLPDYPIYFFCDEAIQTEHAAGLVARHFSSNDGLFPTYFNNGGMWNLSTSVYAQVVPYLLFGKSIFVTRSVTVIFSLLAAVSVALIGKEFLGLGAWWLGVLVLSLTPAWLLHTRTAFEAPLMVSFYVAALYFYLRYRTRDPRALPLAVLCSALSFYSYSPGQAINLGTVLILLVTDARYHLRHRKQVLLSLAVAALLAAPYVRFRIQHPEAASAHLKQLDSYLVQPIPIGRKLALFFANYGQGLSPWFWFSPTPDDLVRHVVLGFGHILLPLLPCFLLGLAIAAANVRRPVFRVLLAAMAASALGGAMVHPGATRNMAFLPLAALLITVGIAKLLESFPRVARGRAELATLVLLVLANGAIIRNAVVSSPSHYPEYGLYGIQYGAGQVFPAIKEWLGKYPNLSLFVSTDWANNTNVVARFFLGDQPRITYGSALVFLDSDRYYKPGLVLVIPANQLSDLKASRRWVNVRVLKTIPYPNGSPGFHFIELERAPDYERAVADELAERRRLFSETAEIGGETLILRHTRHDLGKVEYLFDGTPDTLMRFVGTNPAVVEVDFPRPRPFRGAAVVVGRQAIALGATWLDEAGKPLATATAAGTPPDDTTEIVAMLAAPVSARKARIEIRCTRSCEEISAYIHLRTLRFL